MNQSPLIQSCFTMQIFFQQISLTMLMTTCNTNFQGAVNTKIVILLFSCKVSPVYRSFHSPVSTSHNSQISPLCFPLPRDSPSSWGCPKNLYLKPCQQETPGYHPSITMTHHTKEPEWEGKQVRRAFWRKPLKHQGPGETNSESRQCDLVGDTTNLYSAVQSG